VTLGDALGLAVTVHATLAALFTTVATAAVLFRPRPAASPARPKVLLLRPAEGIDDAFRARLRLDERAYSGALVRLVCTPRAAEGTDVPTGVTEDQIGNRKALHLAAGMREAAARGLVDADTVIVHADADVELGPGDLDALVGALSGSQSVAFAPPAPRGGARLAELVAQAIVCASPQAFASVACVARVTGAAPAIAGKLVAIPAPLLETLGGYASFARSIGDDVALVDAARSHGVALVSSPRAVVAVDPSRTMGSLLVQMTRWLRVASAHRYGLLWTYPTLVAPLALSLLAASVVDPRWALAGATLWALRVLLGAVLLRGPYRGRASLVALLVLPLADGVLCLAAARAAFRSRIAWRGRTYVLGTGGRIVAVE
jgi:hypothetical protein